MIIYNTNLMGGLEDKISKNKVMEHEFKVIHLTKKEQKQRRKRALRYFAAYGINPDTKGNTHQDRILDMPPKPFWKKDDENTITYQCKITSRS